MKFLDALPALFCASVVGAQTLPVSLRSDSNYNGWGWNAVVIENGVITQATVPSIGGRVMQYDLGGIPSVFINQAELDHTYTPQNDGQWHNFGGYKTWPAPQDAWNAGGWPPPPNIDYGYYTVLDTTSSADSVSVTLLGPVEQWFAPGIRFMRKSTVFRGSSRVRMDQTIINQGTSNASWSVWSITQSIVNHPGQKDYTNYWSYFPINPVSVFGPTGVSPQGGNTQAWKGEIALGIYGVQFATLGAKIFADPEKGWIAYANLSDSVVFIRTFDVYDTAQYPDGGARVSVYVSGSVAPIYMEVEVKGPMVTLPPGGGQYTFTENWWAAKLEGPVLFADSVGAIGEKLTYNSQSRVLSGTFGVFYVGTVRAAFLNSSGEIIGYGQEHDVSPLVTFKLNEALSPPDSAKSVTLLVKDESGAEMGTLEIEDLESISTAVTARNPVVVSEFALMPNFPNPFNGGTVLKFKSGKTSFGSLKIYDVLGREVATLVEGRIGEGEHSYFWNPENLPSGVYIARMSVGGVILTTKMAYIR